MSTETSARRPRVTRDDQQRSGDEAKAISELLKGYTVRLRDIRNRLYEMYRETVMDRAGVAQPGSMKSIPALRGVDFQLIQQEAEGFQVPIDELRRHASGWIEQGNGFAGSTRIELLFLLAEFEHEVHAIESLLSQYQMDQIEL